MTHLRTAFLMLALVFGLIPGLLAMDIGKFATLAHELQVRAAVLNRDMQNQYGGNAFACHFVKQIEEFAIACHKLHQLAEKWFVTGVALGLRMDQIEYLADQIEFSALHTSADMTPFRVQWNQLKPLYREMLVLYAGQNPHQGGQNGHYPPATNTGNTNPFPGNQPNQPYNGVGVVVPVGGNNPKPVVIPPTGSTSSGASNNPSTVPVAQPSY